MISEAVDAALDSIKEEISPQRSSSLSAGPRGRACSVHDEAGSSSPSGPEARQRKRAVGGWDTAESMENIRKLCRRIRMFQSEGKVRTARPETKDRKRRTKTPETQPDDAAVEPQATEPATKDRRSRLPNMRSGARKIRQRASKPKTSLTSVRSRSKTPKPHARKCRTKARRTQLDDADVKSQATELTSCIPSVQIGTEILKSCAANMKVGTEKIKKRVQQKMSAERETETQVEDPETILQDARMEPATKDRRSHLPNMRSGARKIRQGASKLKTSLTSVRSRSKTPKPHARKCRTKAQRTQVDDADVESQATELTSCIPSVQIGTEILKSCAANMKVGAEKIKKRVQQKMSAERETETQVEDPETQVEDPETQVEDPETILQDARMDPETKDRRSHLPNMRVSIEKRKSRSANMKLSAKKQQKEAIQVVTQRKDAETHLDTSFSAESEIKNSALAEDLKTALESSVSRLISHVVSKSWCSIFPEEMFPVTSLVNSILDKVKDGPIEMTGREIETKLHLLVYKDLLKLWKKPELIMVVFDINNELVSETVASVFKKHIGTPRRPNVFRRIFNFFFHRG